MNIFMRFNRRCRKRNLGSNWTLTHLRGVEWVHGLFLFPLVLGKMQLSRAKLGLFWVV